MGGVLKFGRRHARDAPVAEGKLVDLSMAAKRLGRGMLVSQKGLLSFSAIESVLVQCWRQTCR